jgi:hypothetical protein
VLLSACSKPTVITPENCIRFVESPGNGLKVKKEINELIFNLQYKPEDYILSKELMNKIITKSELGKRRENLNGFKFFTFWVINKKGKDPVKSIASSSNEYNKMEEYLASEIQNDFSIVSGNDTLPCALAHYEKAYGLSPCVTLVLSFHDKEVKKPDGNSIRFLYRDHIFGIGNVWMKISGNDLNAIPTVRFN